MFFEQIEGVEKRLLAKIEHVIVGDRERVETGFVEPFDQFGLAPVVGGLALHEAPASGEVVLEVEEGVIGLPEQGSRFSEQVPATLPVGSDISAGQH